MAVLWIKLNRLYLSISQLYLDSYLYNYVYIWTPVCEFKISTILHYKYNINTKYNTIKIINYA